MEIRQFFITKTWWGKLIGAFFGFLMAGPIGALLGLLIGNFFDRGLVEHLSKPFWLYHTEKDVNVRRIFFESTFLLFGHIAKSEGRVSEHSIFAARNVIEQMQLNPKAKEKAQDYFSLGKQTTFDLQLTLRALYQAIGSKPTLIRLFIETQYQYIRQTGITEKKLRIMNVLLTTFHLASIYDQQHIRDDFNWTHDTYNRGYSHSSSQQQRPSADPRNNLFNAYQVLGLTLSATQSEVKRAYRRLISIHHPDKLIAKNASEQAIKKANEKTQQIRRAYELICETKGW